MSWKKKIIAATIVLAAVMANFGCESGSNSRTPEVETGLSTVKADTITPEAQEINMPFNLEYNEHGVALNERVLGYADEEKMLIINPYHSRTCGLGDYDSFYFFELFLKITYIFFG